MGIALLIVGLVGVLILFASTSFFTVADDFVYVITRHGEYHHCAFAGNHLRIPFADKIAAKYSLCNLSTVLGGALGKTPLVTSDLQIMQLLIIVEYQIVNPELFYKIAKNEEFINSMTCKLMRQSFGNYSSNDILTGNADIITPVVEALQKTSMDYGAVINNITYQIHS